MKRGHWPARPTCPAKRWLMTAKPAQPAAPFNNTRASAWAEWDACASANARHSAAGTASAAAQKLLRSMAPSLPASVCSSAAPLAWPRASIQAACTPLPIPASPPAIMATTSQRLGLR